MCETLYYLRPNDQVYQLKLSVSNLSRIDKVFHFYNILIALRVLLKTLKFKAFCIFNASEPGYRPI